MSVSQQGSNPLDDEKCIKAGYLIKRGVNHKVWKRRWFVLKPANILYYENDKEYELLNTIPLTSIRTVSEAPLKQRPYALALVMKLGVGADFVGEEEEMKRQKHPAAVYLLDPVTLAERDEWMHAFYLALSTLPSLQLVQWPDPPPSQTSDLVPVPESFRGTIIVRQGGEMDSTWWTGAVDSDSWVVEPEKITMSGFLNKKVRHLKRTFLRNKSTDSSSDEDEASPGDEDKIMVESTATLVTVVETSAVAATPTITSVYDTSKSIWQKRWCVLRKNTLSWYKDDTEYELLNRLDMKDVLDVVPLVADTSATSPKRDHAVIALGDDLEAEFRELTKTTGDVKHGPNECPCSWCTLWTQFHNDLTPFIQPELTTWRWIRALVHLSQMNVASSLQASPVATPLMTSLPPVTPVITSMSLQTPKTPVQRRRKTQKSVEVFAIQLVTGKRNYIFSTKDAGAFEEWMVAFRRAFLLTHQRVE